MACAHTARHKPSAGHLQAAHGVFMLTASHTSWAPAGAPGAKLAVACGAARQQAPLRHRNAQRGQHLRQLRLFVWHGGKI